MIQVISSAVRALRHCLYIKTCSNEVGIGESRSGRLMIVDRPLLFGTVKLLQIRKTAANGPARSLLGPIWDCRIRYIQHHRKNDGNFERGRCASLHTYFYLSARLGKADRLKRPGYLALMRRILMFLNETTPWSPWIPIRPLSSLPKSGHSLNLLFLTRAQKSSLP